MKIYGRQLKEFWDAIPLGYVHVEDDEPICFDELEADERYDLGTLGWIEHEPLDGPSVDWLGKGCLTTQTAYRRWIQRQTTDLIHVRIKKEYLDQVKALIKDMDGVVSVN